MQYYVYILECSNGSYYTGYTTDVERRYEEHVAGTDKCKYTRSFPPIRLAASWKIGKDLSKAMRAECAIKSLTKQQKSNLIKSPKLLAKLISD